MNVPGAACILDINLDTALHAISLVGYGSCTYIWILSNKPCLAIFYGLHAIYQILTVFPYLPITTLLNCGSAFSSLWGWGFCSNSFLG